MTKSSINNVFLFVFLIPHGKPSSCRSQTLNPRSPSPGDVKKGLNNIEIFEKTIYFMCFLFPTELPEPNPQPPKTLSWRRKKGPEPERNLQTTMSFLMCFLFPHGKPSSCRSQTLKPRKLSPGDVSLIWKENLLGSRFARKRPPPRNV